MMDDDRVADLEVGHVGADVFRLDSLNQFVLHETMTFPGVPVRVTAKYSTGPNVGSRFALMGSEGFWVYSVLALFLALLLALRRRDCSLRHFAISW